MCLCRCKNSTSINLTQIVESENEGKHLSWMQEVEIKSLELQKIIILIAMWNEYLFENTY